MKLNIKAFAVSCGILTGAAVFIGTWWVLAFGNGTGGLEFLGDYYFGYSISPVGSFVGLAYGVIDGLIWGAVFAWLYNALTSRFAVSGG